MARRVTVPPVDPNSEEFTRLLRAARERRAPAPLETRWYPGDTPQTDYKTAGRDTSNGDRND